VTINMEDFFFEVNQNGGFHREQNHVGDLAVSG